MEVVCFVQGFPLATGSRSTVRELAARSRSPNSRKDKRCRLFSTEDDSAEDDQTPELDGMMIRWKNQKSPFKDGRDLLPFDVNVLTPPSRSLGRFRLDPRLNCGDIVDYEGTSYVVRRVRMHYAFRNGTFVVTRKTAEVKTMGRKSLESYLERLYNSKKTIENDQ
uniref:Uncharacterized protein n=1 Tax=Rhodosorus marinus TaxID=101924 RepID=A0A7S3E7F6_9RHOD|mmetsp:Transcript_11931/g.49772  ORF Transcript_11931/g.49772 Transcript_11931/m.49772 type:complete len:165 (+) Transcript_11931:286-780(+)|eukprot:CAMPEP_0113955718 /NCGR_PEP_ID=MMETSP0011_2-20120614/1550_1 /TAXON_ID=101924 /ORGANISM="Rhodosorus marinus" /LENGTH=164 /DNA_ID=CAMNT_0000965561 /DNA_START=103 /DNA_END=597 /DNA_ORIENTATION=+ /assembly_acc=CAM_ASM_000156